MLLYRLLLSVFALWTLARAKGRRAARLGLGAPERDAPHVWLHGASNGELASARPVLAALGQARPDLHWLVTCNTATGVALVESWQMPRVTARLAPLDLGWVTARVLRCWRVRAHIALEAELWPNRFRLTPGPVIVLGARMSAGTARIWARLPRLARATAKRITLLIAQDTASRDRLLALGLRPEASGPVVDLKAFYTPPATRPDETLTKAFARAATWLAASTHEGEDETVLDAHLAALRDAPDLRLILAPRHPARADEIARLIDARGLSLARRSQGTPPGGAQVYLADTMGEMALWYPLAGRVFIGGTLVAKGGHTPYEPAAFGCALLFGPDMRNFAPAMARLGDRAVTVRDAASLAAALTCLNAAEAQSGTGQAQARALAPDADLSDLVATLLLRLPAA